MSAIGKVKHFMKELEEFGAVFQEKASLYRVPVSLLKLDALFSRFAYGSPVSQYVGFEFYRLRGRERNTFITDGRTHRIVSIMNHATKEEIDEVDNKPRFNRLFSDFVKREWLFVPEASDEELRSMLERHDALIVKPCNLNKGIGIHIIDCSQALASFDTFVKNAREEHQLLEELIVQHPAMRAINPTSVNTIRVSTARDSQGEVHFLGASLRGGGAGSIVDNFHADGVNYYIDIQTGIINRGGISFDGKKDIYFHPSTGTKMIGFEIPHWEMVLDTVKKAASIPENVRYLGWDVAITEDGCELIEANNNQGCNGMQMDGIGKYPILKTYY